MRVIINIWSEHISKLSTWKARAIEVSNKKEASLIEIFKSARVNENSDLYNLIADGDILKSDFMLYVNGFCIPGSSKITQYVKDNVQIHIYDSK